MSAPLEALYGLPPEVKFCKACVISNQRPSSAVEFKNDNRKKATIQFDEEGICSACRYNRLKATDIDWKAREKKLHEILDGYRSRDGSYDCIVPSSAGKDSSTTAHLLKYKYGMNPLTVTWAPHMFTDVGFRNLQSLASVGGIDNLLYTPNGRLHRTLTRLAFENLGHPFQPFIHGQKIVGPKIASKFGIPMIVYGENQAEYGNSLEDNFKETMDTSFFSIENPKEMIMAGLPIQELMARHGFRYEEFTPYLPLSPREVQDRKISMIYLGYFEKWDPQECYYYAAKNTGFQAADERSDGTYSKYTEIDDKMVPFHFYTTFVKFGIGRATYDACQEIRNGKITREEGVALVRRYDGEFPKTYFRDFLEYLGIDEARFHQVVDGLRSPHLWKKTETGWRLRHTVASTGCDD